MKNGILLWPHQNARYQDAAQPLSLRELVLLVGENHLLGEPRFQSVCGAPMLCFETDLERDDLKARLGDHAHLYLLCEMREDGSMLPLGAQRAAYLGADLSGILKYKGKTNEVFTRFLLNMALYSSAFSGQARQRLRLLDPMCGRGTALFEALNRGWDAAGADIDKQDIHEADAFFKRYLTYHKLKHTQKELSMTVPGRRPVNRKLYTFANDAEAFKAGDVRELSLMQADAQDAINAFPKNSFHLAAIDLPYGVQHAPGGAGKIEPLEKLLSRALPALLARLLPGGAVALSFNAHTLTLPKVRELLERAGFEVRSEGPYEGLSHWVEQAVTRDVAVGTKRI